MGDVNADMDAALSGDVKAMRKVLAGFTPSPTAIVKVTETRADGTQKVTETPMNRRQRRQLFAKVKKAKRAIAKKRARQ